MRDVRGYRTKRRATGAMDDTHPSPRVSITFDHETFARLNALAVDRNIPFGAAVRHYVGLGLKTIPQHSDLEA